MSSASKAGKTLSAVIAVVVAILAIICVLGVISKFTGGFTSSFRTFYISVNGKDVMTTASGYNATEDDPLEVKVKYTFATAENEVSGYTVKVIPHKVDGKDFDFTLDGQTYSFQAETDLTLGFTIVQKEDSFTIAPKGNVGEVLQAVYPNGSISDCDGKGYMDMYSLIVTSYNGESSVTVHFSAFEEVCEITLSEEVIVF